jgi:hypothetical protein
MNKTTVAAFALLLGSAIAVTAPAFAQKPGPNGGLVAGKDGHETELIVAPGEITVYLLHGNKPQATKNANLRMVIQESGKTKTVALKEAGGKLVAKIDQPLGKGAIVVITGKDDHGHAVSSRYVIK